MVTSDSNDRTTILYINNTAESTVTDGDFSVINDAKADYTFLVGMNYEGTSFNGNIYELSIYATN